MSPVVVSVAADLVAIAALTFGLYYRRHGRRDLLLAFVALNTGVLAVTMALTSVESSIGLGLGLFGVLSIIRLRSNQLGQEEVAYYFVALALGLLGGIHPGAIWVTPLLSLGLVAVVYVADHPRILSRSRRTVLTLPEVYADEHSARAAAAAVLGGHVRHLVLSEVDLVREVTVVDVRYNALPAVEAPGPDPAGDDSGTAPAAAVVGGHRLGRAGTLVGS